METKPGSSTRAGHGVLVCRLGGLALACALMLPVAAGAAAPEHDCDRQAADPGDIRRVGSSGVADKDINVFFGAIACGFALSQYPDEPRFNRDSPYGALPTS